MTDILIPFVVVAVLAAAVYYNVVTKPRHKERKRESARRLYAHSLHLKECLMAVDMLREHREEICKRVPYIAPERIDEFRDSLRQSTLALAVTTSLLAKQQLNEFGESPLGVNVALQKEDHALIASVLKSAFGENAVKRHVGLDDEEFAPVVRLLRELSSAGLTS